MAKMKTKKWVAAAVSVVCVIALLLAGTFAWFQVEKATNEFSNFYKEVVLHDDYVHVPGASGEINKDVYVENTGSAYVYVRIQLEEFFQFDITKAPDTIDWELHTPEDDHWYNEQHFVLEWNMGGSKDYAPGIPNEYEADTTGITRKSTLTATVITIDDYVAMSEAEQKTFVGWVYDNDGYVYWSQKLAPGEATGLLLDSVTIAGFASNSEFYAAINVNMEAIDEADLEMWLSGAVSVYDEETTQDEASDEAKAMLALISKVTPFSAWASDLEGTTADIGKVVTVDGYDWVVIHVDDDGNLLLMAKQVKEQSAYMLNADPAVYNDPAEQIALNNKLNDIYGGLTTLQSYAQGANTPLENGGQLYDQFNPGFPFANDYALTTCTGSADGARAFALSASEVKVYLSASNHGLNQYLIARTPSGTAVDWWTRSPGSVLELEDGDISLTTEVTFYGSFAHNASDSVDYVRPALWIALP